jgi:hypothetical protein
MHLQIMAAGLALLMHCVTASAAPIDAVRAGSMEQMIPEIVAIYEDAGLSWDRGIEWHVGAFTTTFWFYDPGERDITVGAVPLDSQIEAYWQTWSDVLTDGHFNPATFFLSEDEARELAHYNQYVLATHESAHAITFRYDYPHLQRHDYAVNCREYYADRLTVAILNEQAQLDADMRRWRARYLQLVEAMGETIPEQYRYHIPDFAALDADCALIDVAQPTPETMQPYASAYFERYRVLLEAKLPPLASVFQTHLSGRWDDAHREIPFAPLREGLELATLAQLEAVALGAVYGEDTSTSADDRTRVAAFDPSGKLWFASLSYDRETRLGALSFGTEPEQDTPILPPAEWHRPSARLEVSSLAVLSADRFLVSLQHWDNGGIEGMEHHFVTFVLASRVNDTWTLNSVAEWEDMRQAVVLRSPAGKLYILATPDATGSDPTNNWFGFEISLERGNVVAQLPIGSGIDFPLAIDDDGQLYEELGFLLWQSAPGGGDSVLIGNGHMGPRDGVGARAEISDVQVMQFMPDGRALFIDRDPRWDAWQLRELRPRQ